MNSFSLERTGFPVLTFDGSQIVDLLDADADGAAGGRYYTLAIYKTNDGEFVIAIGFQSPVASEVSDDYVELAKDHTEVEEVLSLYDPVELLDRNSFEANDTKQYAAVAKTLTHRFDVLVTKALQAMEQTEPAQS